MPAYDNVGGVLRKVDRIYDNINGALRVVNAGYDNIGGVLRQFHSDMNGEPVYYLVDSSYGIFTYNNSYATLLTQPSYKYSSYVEISIKPVNGSSITLDVTWSHPNIYSPFSVNDNAVSALPYTFNTAGSTITIRLDAGNSGDVYEVTFRTLIDGKVV